MGQIVDFPFLTFCRVSRVSIDKGEQLITLYTAPSPWKETAHFMALDFGHSSIDFELRGHGDLRRRQAAPSSTATTAAAASSTTIVSELATTSSLTSIADITYPAPLSPTPTKTFLSASLTSATYISQTILPPDTSLGFHGPDMYVYGSCRCRIANEAAQTALLHCRLQELLNIRKH